MIIHVHRGIHHLHCYHYCHFLFCITFIIIVSVSIRVIISLTDLSPSIRVLEGSKPPEIMPPPQLPSA